MFGHHRGISTIAGRQVMVDDVLRRLAGELGPGCCEVQVIGDYKLSEPLRWPQPRMVFVNSMSDLFHEGVPDDYIVQVARVMEAAAWHTFQVLTKRSERLRILL